MLRDILAFIATAAECAGWLKFCNFLAKKGVTEIAVSRKLIHVGCGLQYLLLWPLFSNLPSARYWAGSVPLFAALKYALVGFGFLQDEELVRSTSRTGDRRELLSGPVAYGVIHGLSAIYGWRNAPAGITTIAILCAGDGLAEAAGRRFGRKRRLPHNFDKSWAGSAACATAGFGAAYLYLQLFQYLGFMKLPGGLQLVGRLWTVSLAGAAVESLPVRNWDNLTVGLAVLLVSELVFA